MTPQLPPLPEPEGVIHIEDRPYDPGYTTSQEAYSEGQMTAYGLQCAEAERARCIAICNEQAKIHQEAAIRAWRRGHTKIADRIERQQTTARICAFNIALPVSPK